MLIMKKTVTPFTLILIAVALALFTGCASNNSSKFASSDYNMLGIVSYSPESYERISNTSFAVHTDEVTARRNVSGDNLQLLWGLITVADY